ncbi:MAG: methyl-accepting chemotaxis protein [Moorellaceae bacterium]
MLGERGVVGVTDTARYLCSKEPPHSPVSAGVKPGDPVKEGTVTWEALSTGRRVERQVSKEKSFFGVGYYAMALPIIEGGKVIGALNLILPTAAQDKLKEIAGELLRVSTEVRKAVDSVAEAATELASSAQEMVELSAELHSGIEVLEEVIGLVHEVAERTHLLSLNAAIEAARAAEHGRGFGVVAAEVRKLAERAKQSAAQMAGRIKHMKTVMQSVTEKINSLGHMSEQQAAASQEISSMMATLNENAVEIEGVAKGGIL